MTVLICNTGTFSKKPSVVGEFRALFLSIILFLVWISPLQAEDGGEASYQQALTLARAGEHIAAIDILKDLNRQYPDNRVYLYDTIAVLGWAARDDEVLSLRSAVDIESVPTYVLETFGRSARNLENYTEAVEYYRLATQRSPDRIESAIGLALSHADNGEASKAIVILDHLANRYPLRKELYEAIAYSNQSAGNQFSALKGYQDTLLIDPADREAQRQRILITAELGAPHLAVAMAQDTPGVLSADEFETITGLQAKQSIFWGGIYNSSPTGRNEDIDAGIELLQDQLKRLEERGYKKHSLYRDAQNDLIVALRDRQRLEEVLNLYQNEIDENAEISESTLLAVADAYMHKGQPEKARDIYLAILERYPGDYDTSIALFYAYFDIGEYDQALDLIDTLAAETLDGQRKSQATTTAAMGYAWSGQLAEAQQRLEPLVDNAPNNPYLRSNIAYVYLWRGWPRRAKQEFQLSKVIEPAVLDAHLGELDTEIGLYEYRLAENNIFRLNEQHPDNTQLKRIQRSWDIHNMRELYVEIGRSTSSGVQEGSQDITYDVYLYSKPLNYNYRIFAHSHYDYSTFPEGTGIYRRQGAGVEYHARDISIIGELSGGINRDSGLGLNLRTNWMPDDFWTLGAHLDTYSNDVPLRGRLNDDVDGWSVGISADYDFHESRSIGLGLQLYEFSDDNRRISGSATAHQRLITRPKYKLDGRVGIYSSDNTLDNATYYNPGSDLSVEIGVINEWLAFRKFSRSLTHRLGFSVGTYRQSGFDPNGIWSLDYEHQWSLDDRLGLTYGIARSRPVYDSVSETKMRYYMMLDWRF